MNEDYPPEISQIVETLDTRQPLPRLTPKEAWQRELTVKLQNMPLTNLFGNQLLKDASLGNTVKIGLLLWNDALDEAHHILQEINTKTGHYWHAIMHRREPNYENSKYWFNRVSNHPIYPALRKNVLDLLKGSLLELNELTSYAMEIEDRNNWDAVQFVEWCQTGTQNPNVGVAKFLRRTQVEEIKLLLDYSFQNALTLSSSTSET